MCCPKWNKGVMTSRQQHLGLMIVVLGYGQSKQEDLF